jgi:hypothetical protein
MILVVALFASCRESAEHNQPIEVFGQTIHIDEVVTVLPNLPGHEEVKANCITCHSLRYIEMQPDFPREKWETIVQKMVKNYGAPMPDSTVQLITDYLTAIKSGNR